ncbi:hypothetical protein FEZ51_06350 [Pediococcus stilesii]|uniref:Uncharacterized protein n=1 Tax=Pediococcus stilesii TaxID=331679 RepID=A0A5R9BUJ9_9LACO|nr:hypothetical protein [Pediococcus stilesii]TLQ04215.1 hypothetical protein FEZ51_06350 [Pediococcus stilesii]
MLIMDLGIGFAAIGVLLLAITTKWTNGWIFNYKTTNRSLSLIGWILLILGLILTILPPYLGGLWN